MTISLKHTTQAVGTDAGNGEIRKTQWNEEHALTMATNRLLGRSTASAGAAEEISLGAGLTLSGGTLSPTGPAFHVNKNGTDQTGIADVTETKLTWSNEVFDTDSCFASNKFTPNVAGYYLFTLAVYFSAGLGLTNMFTSLWKNGARFLEGGFVVNVGDSYTSVMSGIIYLNGTTDYVEAYAQGDVSSGTITVSGSATSTFFQGCFLRS